MSRKVDKLAVTTRWLSIEQAAQYLTLSRDQIDKLVGEGTLTKHKLGPHPRSRVLLAKSDLDAYVESCRTAVN